MDHSRLKFLKKNKYKNKSKIFFNILKNKQEINLTILSNFFILNEKNNTNVPIQRYFFKNTNLKFKKKSSSCQIFFFTQHKKFILNSF